MARAADQEPDSPPPVGLGLLSLGALGVVYGDIGTSPLYVIRECFHGLHAITPSGANVLGVLSLIFWSLLIVITLKYIVFIIRIDNQGEGGIVALMGLLPQPGRGLSASRRSALVLMAIFGAALLYGDGNNTPSISVLAAVAGLKTAAPSLDHLVLPLACLILIGLFLFQRRGTAGIGRVFGPAMLVWFLVIAGLGLIEIIAQPQVLSAVNPLLAARFFLDNGLHGLRVLGSVVLCITGGEALYADLGHFSRSSIRLGWYGVVCPALLLNYFGQGALLIGNPHLAANPFLGLAPQVLQFPMIVLSTLATVIASQAMISGIFSLTQQAVQLGFLPRLRIVYTSAAAKGQIYIPAVNWVLMVACLGLVLFFQSSARLAGAYGLAVTATMAITSIIYFHVVTRARHWPIWTAGLLVGLFLVFDVSYFGVNLFKLLDGGWLTLAVAAVVTTIMATWKDGRAALAKFVARGRVAEDAFLADVDQIKPVRIPGTAVFMSVSPQGIPPSLMHYYKFNKVLHERVIIMSIITTQTPFVRPADRLTVMDLGLGFYRVVAYFGFMETPDVPQALRLAKASGLDVDPAAAAYYLSRESLLLAGPSRMMAWRKRLFARMSKNATNPPVFFNLPPGRVVELGIQVEL